DRALQNVEPVTNNLEMDGNLVIRLLVTPIFDEAGMCAGVVTPTEAGGLGSLIALVMGVAMRRLTLRGICCAVADTLRITAMILLLVTSAMIYGKFLNATRLPFELSGMIAGLHAPDMLVLLCMLAIYFVGGMLMDALALLLITLPIFFPLAQAMGFDPIWFSLVITVVTTIGAVTPPVGVCPYVVASMDRSIPLPDIFRGIACYFPAYAIVVALLMIFPWLII
ncbi:MAG: TRAP transporter large permease subunit, partial [Mailhella sp.]|nr:TRAP transporter large permease subunit [Mailhella sp.]